MRRVVVVGGGIAGVTACESLRAAGFDGELTVVGTEPRRAYSRPALSKALLHDTGDGALIAHELPEPTHEATELLGIGATGLETDARRIRLSNGDSLPYDGLVIASGSRARRLGDGPNELTLRTFDDAVALKAQVATGPSVVVIGGGPLGMEVASGCVHAGCEVTLVTDRAPLSRQLGAHLSAVFADAAERHGVRIVSGGRARLADSAEGARVLLEDGTALEAELVVTAVGDDPNTEWLAGSGLPAIDGSLRVDSRGRVRPEVVAAGDVAWLPTRHGVRRVPLWTSAIDQAKAAAIALLRGDEAPELAFDPYFWTEGFGISLKAAGFTPLEGDPDHLETGAVEDSRLLRWSHADGTGTAVAINYRIPIPKLRRLAREEPVRA